MTIAADSFFFLIFKELKQQEKEVKQQIELFRLDSWHFQNKLNLMKGSLEPKDGLKHKTSTPDKSLAKKARNNKKENPEG